MADDPTIRIEAGDVKKRLEKIEGALQQPRPFLQMIAEELFRVGRNSFEKQTSPDGTPWRVLSRRYAAWKAKKFPGRGILRLRGQLIRGLRRGVTGNTAWATAGPLAHAAVHQFGFDGTVNIPEHSRKVKLTRRQKRMGITSGSRTVRAHTRHMRMPARPYLGFPKSSEQRVIQDIETGLKEQFDKGGPSGQAGN